MLATVGIIDSRKVKQTESWGFRKGGKAIMWVPTSKH